MADWIEITTVQEWKQALLDSDNQVLVVLKHSTTCPISAKAFRQSDAYVRSASAAPAQYVLVKVIESRPVSNEIALDTNIKHESPQLLVLKQQQVVWHASHYAITTDQLASMLASFRAGRQSL